MKRFFKLRYLLWTLVSLVTFYFLVVALENWTGARALAEARARVEAAGETLDFKRLLPPPIPDAANFCALEPLAGITDPKHQPAEALTALELEEATSEGQRTAANLAAVTTENQTISYVGPPTSLTLASRSRIPPPRMLSKRWMGVSRC